MQVSSVSIMPNTLQVITPTMFQTYSLQHTGFTQVRLGCLWTFKNQQTWQWRLLIHDSTSQQSALSFKCLPCRRRSLVFSALSTPDCPSLPHICHSRLAATLMSTACTAECRSSSIFTASSIQISKTRFDCTVLGAMADH